jgi:gliding motility-associated-like protein
LFWSSADPAAGKTQFTVHVLVRDRDGNEIDRLLTINRERSPLGQLEIYNTFTPKGDGQNDTWGVPELRFFNRVQITVMERSGQRVFSTDNPDRRWDGTDIYSGKELPEVTYFWIIEIKRCRGNLFICFCFSFTKRCSYNEIRHTLCTFIPGK